MSPTPAEAAFRDRKPMTAQEHCPHAAESPAGVRRPGLPPSSVRMSPGTLRGYILGHRVERLGTSKPLRYISTASRRTRMFAVPPAAIVHLLGGSVMRRSPLVLAVVFLALAQLQAQAQTSVSVPSKATRIEYAAPYAAMSVTDRAILTDGVSSTALVFEEAQSPMPLWQYYTTNPVHVVPGMQLSNEAVSVIRITAMPPDPRRGPLCVMWNVCINLVDATSGKVLQRVSPVLWCTVQHSLDTVMSSIRRLDLTEYSGRTVYLKMIVAPDPEPEMTESRHTRILTCTNEQPLQAIQ